MRGQRFFAGVVLLASMLAPPSVVAQTAPDVATPKDSDTDPPPQHAPPPPTRSVVFSPDNQDAQLQFRGIGLIDGAWNDGWIPVCSGACAGNVPLAQRYRVSGPGVRSSQVFEIGPGAKPLQLAVQTGSSTAFVWGTVASISGGVALGSGMLFALVAGACGYGDSREACDSRKSDQTAGLVVAGAGALALILGIVQLKDSHTVVTGLEPPARAP